MAEQRWYPMFLDIRGKRVLIVGGGRVALRKAKGVREAGACVVVVAPEFVAEFVEMDVEQVRREFEDSDVEGTALVFAATNSRDVNRRVGEVAWARGIPANIADAPEECGFIVPARVEHDGLTIAVSTGGADPSRAAKMKKRLEQWLKASCDHEENQ
jgi:siroheme synthase-like protein